MSVGPGSSPLHLSAKAGPRSEDLRNRKKLVWPLKPRGQKGGLRPVNQRLEAQGQVSGEVTGNWTQVSHSCGRSQVVLSPVPLD